MEFLTFNKKTSIKKLLILLSISGIFLVSILVAPKIVHAQATAGVCENFDPEDPQIIQIFCPVMGVINAMVLSAGVIFVVMIIFGSYKYATSMGDPKAAMGAQKSITWAVFGLLAVVGVFVMLNVVGNIFGFDDSVRPAGVYDRIVENVCAFFNVEGENKAIVCMEACGCSAGP